MKNKLLILLIAVFTALPVTLQAQKKKVPNVVVILADDLGWTDLSSYGSSFYETPHLDKLAGSGVKFTQGYAASPVCSPTRASLLTGKYPSTTYNTDWFGAPQPWNYEKHWTRDKPLIPAEYNPNLPLEEFTLAEAFQQAGYRTFFAGKWHLGEEESHWPLAHGFDINIAGNDKGAPSFGNKYFAPYKNPQLEEGPDGEYLPLRLGHETSRFIRENKDRPFFALLSFYAVHNPIMTTPELEAKYQSKREKMGLTDRFKEMDGQKHRLNHSHVKYAGLLEAMDTAVGQVMKTLEENHLLENTIVVFLSDNGGLSTAEGSPTSNIPLRAGKGWLYEGGIRVPFIISWKGKIAAETVSEVPVTSTDIYPTLMDLTRVTVPGKVRTTWDGISIAPALLSTRRKISDRPLYWHYPHYGNQGGSPGSAIREEDWKLIYFYEDKHVELYNIRNDPGEQEDLSKKYPERTKELQSKLLGWLKNSNAALPSANESRFRGSENGKDQQGSAGAPKADRPNIIYILADDLGYGEVGVFGQKKIETPNLDKLAGDGMVFTQHYSSAPVCAPARYMMLTGQHSGHAWIRGNDEWGERGNVWSYEAMVADSTLEGQRPVPDSISFFPERMQAVGYRTGVFGKWGLGAPHTSSIPNKKGFDEFYGYICQRIAHNYTPVHLYKNEKRLYLNNDTIPFNRKLAVGINPLNKENYPWLNQPDYAPDLIFEELSAFITSAKEEPFFLYWATPLPHVALQAPERWVEYYRKKFGEETPYDGRQGYFPNPSPHATYAAMISYLDENIGKLIQQLKDEGKYDNTLIIFTSDNGPSYAGGADPLFFQSGGMFEGRYGRGKGFVYEGGVRVPFIASWPGHIAAGSRTDHVSIQYDLMVTLSEIAHFEPLSRHDGISFAATLLGREENQEEHDFLYWEFPEYGGQIAIRMGDWKVVRRHLKTLKEAPSLELYNLREDPLEKNNLAEKHPEIIQKAREIYDREHTEPFQERFLVEW